MCIFFVQFLRFVIYTSCCWKSLQSSQIYVQRSIWKQPWQIKIVCMKELRWDWTQGMSAAIWSNTMEQSPCEANRFSASHKIPHIEWNPKDHYHVYKSLLLVPVPSQMNPVHAPIPSLGRCISILSSYTKVFQVLKPFHKG